MGVGGKRIMASGNTFSEKVIWGCGLPKGHKERRKRRRNRSVEKWRKKPAIKSN